MSVRHWGSAIIIALPQCLTLIHEDMDVKKSRSMIGAPPRYKSRNTSTQNCVTMATSEHVTPSSMVT